MINKAVSCVELLKEYEETKTLKVAKQIHFLGVEGYDVYNITVPFVSNGKIYIAGRVEKRDDEISHVRFFEKVDETHYQAVFPEIVFEKFQDPCVTKIGDEIIIGGVQIETNPLISKQIISWKTLFFKGKDIESLELFASGPSRMKDIRLIALKSGGIGIFSRPQGELGGMGSIGFVAVDSLSDVTAENILKAKIFKTHFHPEEWGGANEIHLLNSGLLGVVGHISYKTDQLHYHPMVFVFNPETLEHTQVKIIARRGDVPKGDSKRPDLVDVLFTGGLVRNADETCFLYTGVSDCEAYFIEVQDPFSGF